MKILIFAKPAIGDVLLATPLIHSIRNRHPDAIIDLMLTNGQEGIVEGNRDIDTVIAVAARPGFRELYGLARRLWRKYDIAISNGADDRAYLFLWLFGKMRVAVSLKNSAAWKRWITYATVENEVVTHALLRNNALGNLLGYESCFTVFPPGNDKEKGNSARLTELINCGSRYAVLHLDARLPYKRWHAEGWFDVAHFLAGEGVTLYLTGGNGEEERRYLRSVMDSMPASSVDLSGKLRFAEVSELIANCAIYVGIDTVNSHIAGAQGAPAVVLFGPGDPRRWGPWPKDFESSASPWKSIGSQRIGNVMVVQAEAACDTCEKGKCAKERFRGTDCPSMLNITSQQVIDGISKMLADTAAP